MDYAHPEVLASTEWVSQHVADPNVRVVEVDVDTKAYDEGHVPGALAWAWNTQLCDTVRRDILSKEQFEELMSSSGVGPETTLVIYGDNNNWFAAWALWQAKIYGHGDVRLMNGGRKKWLAEGRDLSTEAAARSAGRITGRRTRTFPCAPTCRRCGRPPATARRRWWTCAARRNSRAKFWRRRDFRRPASAAAMYLERATFHGGRRATTTARSNRPMRCASFTAREGVDGCRPVIAYCRIGERSSHTWFALKYLLGFDNASNYDGSWTEWGNLVGAPVERGAATGAAGA